MPTSTDEETVYYIDQGNRVPWMVRTVIWHLLTLPLFYAADSILYSVLTEYGVRYYYFHIAFLLCVVLTIFSCAWSLSYIRNNQIEAAGTTVEGIDLWHVERIRYCGHTVWFDKVKLSYIAKPKVFVQNCEDYFQYLTGYELP